MTGGFFDAHSPQFRTIEGGFCIRPAMKVGSAEEVLSSTRNDDGWVFGSLIRVKMPSGRALYLHVRSN